jgi:uncharacterized protein (TIGR03000 family)
MRMTPIVGSTLAALLFAAAPGFGQTGQPYSRTIITGQIAPDQGTLRPPAETLGPRYYYYPRSTLPTYMTSINYPFVYGAYVYPYPTGSFTYGAAQSQFTTAPAVRWDYYSGAYVATSPVVSMTAASPTPGRSALLDVRVPPDAELRFNGVRAPQTGELRRYAVPDLAPDMTYSYDLTATWFENGRQVTRQQDVTFRAGDELTVDLWNQSSGAPKISVLKTRPLP